MTFRRATLATGIIALLCAPAVSPAVAQDAQSAQVEAAIASRPNDARLEACLASAPAVRDYRIAQESLANVGNPKWAAKFNCSGIGASWQEVAPQACCSVFERDKGRNADAAWNALQSCGWRAKLEERRPAYLTAARNCLGDAAPASPGATTAPRGDGADPWRNAPSADAVRRQVRGQDAFAVFGGPSWQIFNTAGRLRAVPGYLGDRLRQGYITLDDRRWLTDAVGTLGVPGLSVDAVLTQMGRGGPAAADAFVWFGPAFVRHYFPGTSLIVPVGRQDDSATTETCVLRKASSEHGTIRGCINGGGDFIRFDGGRPGTAAPSRPRLLRAGWPAPPAAVDLQLELAAAIVTAPGQEAAVAADQAPNGAAAILVLRGRVQVRERATSAVREVSAGEAVLVWPGTGVSRAVRAAPDRLAAATRPRIRGSLVLQPGETWEGRIPLGQRLVLELRAPWDKPAGAIYALEISINGRALTAPLVNKQSPMRYADGRNFPYLEPGSARWLVFYSHDWQSNNSGAGGGYEVRTDPGQAYRYEWDISALAGSAAPDVRFRNGLTSGPAVELRLVATDDVPVGPLPRVTDTAPAGPVTALDEREPNDLESGAMPVGWGTTVRAASTFTTAYQDRDHYLLDGAAAGRYTIRLTPGACPLWFNLPATGPSRTIAKAATIVIERLPSSDAGTRVRTTLEIEGQAASTAESVKTGLPDRWLLAVQNDAYSTRMDGTRRLVQCASGSPFVPEVPYTLAFSRDGAPTAAAPSPAPPATVPPPTGTSVVRGGDFGEPAGPTGRIFDLVMARGVEGGRPIGRTSEFLPGDNPIHLRFGLEGFAAGTQLTARWTYFPASGPMVIGTGEFTVPAASDYGTVSYELAAGKRWPAGRYEVEVLLGNTVLGSAAFNVAGR